MRHSLPAVAALLLVTACSPSPENHPAEAHGASAQDLAAISRLHDAYVLAHNDADVPRMIALYTEDGVLMPTDEPALTGREAIGDHYEEFFDQTPSKIRKRPADRTFRSVEAAGMITFSRGGAHEAREDFPGPEDRALDRRHGSRGA